MRRDDEELERYLSEFRPRAVRALELPQPAAQAWIRPLAFAAVLLICAGGGLWYVRHGASIPSPAPTTTHTTGAENFAGTRRPNPFSLTKLALENDGRFEAQLDAESRLVLPGFQGEQSSLRIFAKE